MRGRQKKHKGQEMRDEITIPFFFFFFFLQIPLPPSDLSQWSMSTMSKFSSVRKKFEQKFPCRFRVRHQFPKERRPCIARCRPESVDYNCHAKLYGTSPLPLINCVQVKLAGQLKFFKWVFCQNVACISLLIGIVNPTECPEPFCKRRAAVQLWPLC